MRKLLSLALCLSIFASMAMGCSGADETTITSDTTAASTTEATTEATTSESVPETTAEPEFTFQPKVCSHFYEDIYGTAMCETWYSLVDAVMAGEDTFSCPNGHTYLFVMRDFPDAFFPVLKEIIKEPDNYDFVSVDGTAQFEYKVSREEAARMIDEFSAIVEDILNETMHQDYSDFEKALSLYSYFTHTYTYDYDTARLIDNNEFPNYTSAYRVLTGKNGICSEISTAYSYLLLEAGVEAATVQGGNHQWSIVRLGDEFYHVDPTFGLEKWDYLGFFLMTDEQRSYQGDFDIDEFERVSAYSPEVEPDYTADDNTFEPLWDSYLTGMDHENHTIEYTHYGDAGEVVGTFDYSGY